MKLKKVAKNPDPIIAKEPEINLSFDTTYGDYIYVKIHDVDGREVKGGFLIGFRLVNGKIQVHRPRTRPAIAEYVHVDASGRADIVGMVTKQ